MSETMMATLCRRSGQCLTSARKSQRQPSTWWSLGVKGPRRWSLCRNDVIHDDCSPASLAPFMSDEPVARCPQDHSSPSCPAPRIGSLVAAGLPPGDPIPAPLLRVPTPIADVPVGASALAPSQRFSSPTWPGGLSGSANLARVGDTT
ncbi:predicted protein [Aspergillus terreus NIH2624]|uniref:Uncharacterized protein n=1 Tax=Aspergillus terreus (strain NIH 2624 / FGSC A1156) TaxID=341663 RepID=Q0C878_ASPTN|nr:uncharacterized protein ATEG_10106 [Aspergillus terreus NIH2624]EAU29555.1 predicted protein [Aspergillus terreus NIH2624]